MADTLGSLIDKLFTVDLKMWYNQELLYALRRMTFKEFKEEYIEKEGGPEKLWESLKKACDLNVQRNALIDEIDSKVIELVEEAASGKELDNGRFLQRKHKTY